MSRARQRFLAVAVASWATALLCLLFSGALVAVGGQLQRPGEPAPGDYATEYRPAPAEAPAPPVTTTPDTGPVGVPWAQVPGNDGWWVQKPPARFRVGQGVAVVGYQTAEEVAHSCSSPDALACAIRGEGHRPPIIVMPDPCAPAYAGERFAQLQCHENSHAFGAWRHERD